MTIDTDQHIPIYRVIQSHSGSTSVQSECILNHDLGTISQMVMKYGAQTVFISTIILDIYKARLRHNTFQVNR